MTTLRGTSGHESTMSRRANDESGATLILALVFLVAVSLVVLGLLDWVGTSLTATASFSDQRVQETDATSAVNLAIQESRITFAGQMENAFGGATASASAPSNCWFNNTGVGQQPPQIGNDTPIYVWCSMIWQPFSANTRTVTYSACPYTVSNIACAAAPLLQVVEVYDDYPPGVGVPLVNPVQCNFYNYCGQSMTQVSWTWRPTVPVVTSVSPSTTSIAGGAPITITGSGFLPGSSVNFTEESGGAPTSNNVVITVPSSQVTASNCTVLPNNTCTTLSLPAPSVTAGVPTGSLAGSYFVTVTTPGMATAGGVPTPGATSLFVQPGGVLNYSNATPTVTAISGTSVSGGVPGGNIAGGSTITLTGTGFFNTPNFAAQVWLYCDTAKTNCSGAVPVMASNVNVVSNTTLTAVTPAVTTSGDWYVQVDTIGGNSTQPPTLDFNYGVQVPIIINISPTSGAAGTQINVTGDNFLNGSTVSFCLDQNGNPQTGCFDANGNLAPTGPAISATSTINSPTSMTVTVPNSGLTANAQYFPVITLPTIQNYSASSPHSSQPYNESSDIFTFQSVSPTVNITYPVNGTHYYSTGGGGRTAWSGTITGTASSNSAGTISTTAVAIEDTTTNRWWNGTSFSATTQTFVAATGTTSWSYAGLTTAKLNAQNAGDSYTVTGEATDSLNNQGTSASITFRYG